MALPDDKDLLGLVVVARHKHDAKAPQIDRGATLMAVRKAQSMYTIGQEQQLRSLYSVVMNVPCKALALRLALKGDGPAAVTNVIERGLFAARPSS